MNKKHYIVYQITNKINNNIYIGVHVTENINDKYFGSGTNIKKAIKDFGKENFEKIILHNFDTKEEMLEKERELVNDEFIKRGDTYNIILGGGQHLSLNIVNVKDKHGNTYSVHKTDPRYLSGELISTSVGMINVKDNNDNIIKVSIDNDDYMNGKLKHISKGMVTAKDKNGNFIYVNINDKRFLTGEISHMFTDMVIVKDKHGSCFSVHKTDPRYLSGELKYHWYGKKHKPETRLKMSIAKKDKYNGKNHPHYGSCWICNLELKKNKKIKKDDIDIWLNKGWLKGRKMYF